MNSFFAMMSRMKYIDRWALMRNSRDENLSEHSLEVSMIAHALAVIGTTGLKKELNAERAAVLGLYHDATEIITGDMPTPVKYYKTEIKNTLSAKHHIPFFVCFRTVCRRLTGGFLKSSRRMTIFGSW